MTILMINTSIKVSLTSSLLSYYEALEQGDFPALATLMTKKSFLTLLRSLGFKRAFKDKPFKDLLKRIEGSQAALKKVERLLSEDLATTERRHDIALLAFDSNGSNRVTVRYTEDGYPKKLHFVYIQGRWKIDFSVDRPKNQSLFQVQNIA